jgi:RNA polymerase sigma-70 factor (ECF subfamily)
MAATSTATDRLAFWLGQVALGDQPAFEQLYRATSAHLLGVALLVLRRRERAEEVLQEAFVNVWHNAGGYAQTSASPMSWLIAIVRNKALDHLRSSKHADTHESLDEHESLASERPDPLALLTEASGVLGLRTCLDSLDAPLRQSLALAYYEGRTHDEVARHLRAPLGTVKTWLRRGLERLRACLDGLEHGR